MPSSVYAQRENAKEYNSLALWRSPAEAGEKQSFHRGRASPERNCPLSDHSDYDSLGPDHRCPITPIPWAWSADGGSVSERGELEVRHRHSHPSLDLGGGDDGCSATTITASSINGGEEETTESATKGGERSRPVQLESLTPAVRSLWHDWATLRCPSRDSDGRGCNPADGRVRHWRNDPHIGWRPLPKHPLLPRPVLDRRCGNDREVGLRVGHWKLIAYLLGRHRSHHIGGEDWLGTLVPDTTGSRAGASCENDCDCKRTDNFYFHNRISELLRQLAETWKKVYPR